MAIETPTVVYLGNRKAIEVVDDPDNAGGKIRRPLPGKLRTKVVLPLGTKLMEAAQEITGGRGVWGAHSDADAPAWVASTDANLAQLLASHWGCELREPEDETAPAEVIG